MKRAATRGKVNQAGRCFYLLLNATKVVSPAAAPRTPEGERYHLGGETEINKFTADTYYPLNAPEEVLHADQPGFMQGGLAAVGIREVIG